MSTIPDAWQCEKCGEAYRDEDAAIECCRPRITEGYPCQLCNDFHREEADAIACCDFDPDGPPPPPTAEELERAGQMRLMP